MPYKLPVTAGYKQPMQVLLPILPLLQFKPPSSIIKDKISITPFYKVVDSVSQLYGSVIEYKVTKKCYWWGYS